MATISTAMSGAQFYSLPYDEGRNWELLAAELIEMPATAPPHQGMVVPNSADAPCRQSPQLYPATL
jgi:hypothetical protein